jgi:hypothetical protein
MKYYIGRVQVRDGLNQYDADACIAAKNEAQAQHLLETRAQLYGGDDGEPVSDGWYGFEADTVAVRAEGLTEVSAVTFFEMSRLLPVFGESGAGDLAQEPTDQRVRTLARRIGDQLAKRDAKVPHSKLLHAVAASLGETDWQVLVHKQDTVKPAAVEALEWPDNGLTQPFVPGTGFLWGVPVSVDTSMTARVLVRARDKEEAMQLAREFAQEGNAKFTVDDGNYRGLADHYVPDSEEVYHLNDDGKQVPAEARLEEAYDSAQRGGYLVELTNLNDGEDGLLWADLSIFDPEQEEPDTVSCGSSCPEDASPEEVQAFVTRVAELLYRAAPDPAAVDNLALQHAFTQAVQGDLSDEAIAAIEARLRSSVRRV